MDHNNDSHHNADSTNQNVEYAKFTFIMIMIFIASWAHAEFAGMEIMQFLESFMGVFFLVFATFKLIKIKEFAYGFQSYDVIAKKSVQYAFMYPFIQLIFGLLYIFGLSSRIVDFAVLLISAISAIGVVRALDKKSKIHCVCLGNVIKLPLSTISFVEDFGMALMAIAMIALR